jgi:hypothetical protein
MGYRLWALGIGRSLFSALADSSYRGVAETRRPDAAPGPKASPLIAFSATVQGHEERAIALAGPAPFDGRSAPAAVNQARAPIVSSAFDSAVARLAFFVTVVRFVAP